MGDYLRLLTEASQRGAGVGNGMKKRGYGKLWIRFAIRENVPSAEVLKGQRKTRNHRQSDDWRTIAITLVTL